MAAYIYIYVRPAKIHTFFRVFQDVGKGGVVMRVLAVLTVLGVLKST